MPAQEEPAFEIAALLVLAPDLTVRQIGPALARLLFGSATLVQPEQHRLRLHAEERSGIEAVLAEVASGTSRERTVHYRLASAAGDWISVRHQVQRLEEQGRVLLPGIVHWEPSSAGAVDGGGATRALGFARILQRMTESIASTDEPREMLDAMVRTIGEGLALDRCLIFDVARDRGVASGLCEYLNPASRSAFSVLQDFQVEIFRESVRQMMTTRQLIISHADDVAPSLASEGSAQLVHGELRIASLLWLPFAFRPTGMYLLVLNQLERKRVWQNDEIAFIHAAATHASLAMQKRRILYERLEAQEQLRQSQKLEAIGRLAGGVAHDFNNLLTAIIGYADLLRVRLADPTLVTYVDGILQVANRAATTTHQLLAFSRRQVVSPKVIDINTIVVQLDGMLRRLIGENIQLEVQLGEGIGCVRADPGQLELALVNLAVNGRDAMPSGGRLQIATHAGPLPTELIERLGLPPGRYVRISVRDDGMGMDEQTQKHLFEPFFTTKEVGKGTGLGLSSVYGIIQAAGGGIQVTSGIGQGSTFSVYLPQISASEASPTRGRPVLPEADAGHEERILLVEDDSILRDMIADALRTRGYRVLTAALGAEALAIAARESRIDLLLSDVVMPRMNGPQVARALLRLHPSTHLLFMSGYTADAFTDSPDLAHVPVLAKPFSIDQLALAVRQALAASPTARSIQPVRRQAGDPPRS